MIDLSIVIPALNESDNLRQLLPELAKVAQTLGCEYEIVIADAGSDHAAVDLAEEYHAGLFVQQKKGYGAAIKEAFLQTKGRFVITMDGDLSHSPDVVRQLYKERDQADIIIASRYTEGGTIATSAIRKYMSIFLNRTFTRMLRLPLKDISSGCRLYKKEVLQGLSLEFDRFEILEEIIVKAYMAGYRIVEIPLHYLPRKTGRSHSQAIQYALGLLRGLYKCWKWRYPRVISPNGSLLTDHKKATP